MGPHLYLCMIPSNSMVSLYDVHMNLVFNLYILANLVEGEGCD